MSVQPEPQRWYAHYEHYEFYGMQKYPPVEGEYVASDKRPDDRDPFVLYDDARRWRDEAVAAAEASVIARLGQWQEHSPMGGKTYQQGVSDERARVRAGVEALFPQERYPDEHAAILAVIDGEVSE